MIAHCSAGLSFLNVSPNVFVNIFLRTYQILLFHSVPLFCLKDLNDHEWAERGR